MKPEGRIYGLMAEFHDPGTIVTAARRAYQAGYRTMDAYTPGTRAAVCRSWCCSVGCSAPPAATCCSTTRR